MQRIALITGANKGIGFEVARQIGRSGATVLIGARNRPAGEEAAARLAAEELKALFIEIDVTDHANIAAAARWIDKRFGRLDILVNNAGIAIIHDDGLPSSADLLAIETTLRTNFLGAVAVAQAMLPLLRKAPSARIVNVSSGLGSLTKSGDPNSGFTAHYLGYAASKAALNMLTVQLAQELRGTAIKVNSADPGYTATDLNQYRGTQTVPEGAAETVRLALLPDDGPSGTYSNSKGIIPW
jgi:NAD(P)-dependent dehydrogenase (short-subunit alcohol dehydrogenase family)